MRLSSRRNPVAFTLVELLVVIAIIGVLVSLLLPAIQMAREAARRIQCASNLKQLSLAVINYENSLRTLPAAGIVDIGYTPPKYDIKQYNFWYRSGKMFSWAVLVLPYMEQGTLHQQFNFDVSVLEQSGNPQAEQPAIFLCPSDGAQGRLYIDHEDELLRGTPFGKGNYAAYCSTYHVDMQNNVSFTHPDKEAHAFPGAITEHGQKLIKITDGMSKTLMLAEVRTRDQQQDQRGAWALPWAGASLLSIDRHSKGRMVFIPDDELVGYAQTPNYMGMKVVDTIWNCVDPAGAQWDRMPCKTVTKYNPDAYCSAAPRSLHPGGVNASFADGRVAFLPDDIDEDIMAFMVSINDGRVINVQEHTR